MRQRTRSSAVLDLAQPADDATSPQPATHTQPPPPDSTQLVRDVGAELAAAATFEAAKAGLASLLAPYRISTGVIAAVLGLVDGGTAHRPNAKPGSYGLDESTPAMKMVRDHELYFRASYVMNAARRVQADVNSGETIQAALSDESPYYRAHERARDGRQRAVAAAARAAEVYGQDVEGGHLVGWYLNPLLNNEIECKTANGHNFIAEQGTVIGYPGAVHSRCGCSSGPPHEGAETVNDVLGNVVRFGRPRTFKRMPSGGARTA